MTKRTIWHQTVDMTWLNNLQQLSTSRTKAKFSFVRVSNSHRRNNAVKLLLWCSFAWCQIFCFTLFVPNCLLPNCLFSYLGADLSICLIPDICHFFARAKFLENKIYTEKTCKLRQNTQKIANFLRYYDKIHSKLPIFRVKSVKNYTGQKKFTREFSWISWQIWGMLSKWLQYYIGGGGLAKWLQYFGPENDYGIT